MATTPTQLLTWGFAKSRKNTSSLITTESAELLQLVIRTFRGLYAFAARVNPAFFGTSAAVAYSAPGWARPAAAEAVFRIENPSNAEVVVVPIDQRTIEPAKPAVYRWGQVYRSAGNANDPVSGNLMFFYSKRPTDPATVDDNVDATWPEQFNELAVYEIAIYLALKDGRVDEAQGLTQSRDKWATLFMAFLEHETMNEVRAYGGARPFLSPSRLPLTSLLAGLATPGGS